jgi:hypothetical protein
MFSDIFSRKPLALAIAISLPIGVDKVRFLREAATVRIVDGFAVMEL